MTFVWFIFFDCCLKTSFLCSDDPSNLWHSKLRCNLGVKGSSYVVGMSPLIAPGAWYHEFLCKSILTWLASKNFVEWWPKAYLVKWAALLFYLCHSHCVSFSFFSVLFFFVQTYGLVNIFCRHKCVSCQVSLKRDSNSSLWSQIIAWIGLALLFLII